MPEEEDLVFDAGSTGFCEKCGIHDCDHEHGDFCQKCYRVQCCCKCSLPHRENPRSLHTQDVKPCCGGPGCCCECAKKDAE